MVAVPYYSAYKNRAIVGADLKYSFLDFGLQTKAKQAYETCSKQLSAISILRRCLQLTPHSPTDAESTDIKKGLKRSKSR